MDHSSLDTANTKTKTYQINGYSLEHVRNRNEPRVVEILREELPGAPKFCGCRICVEDAYAAALNAMTPQYAQVGSIILRKQPTQDEMRQLVIGAIERVRSHPKHSQDPPPAL